MGVIQRGLKVDDRFGGRGKLLFAINFLTIYLAHIGIELAPFVNDKMATLDTTVASPCRKNHEFLGGMNITFKMTTDGQTMDFHIRVGNPLFGNRYGIPLDLAAHATTNQELAGKLDGSLHGKPIVDNR